MTSWFNLIVSNRIIHENKLPKWGYTLPKSFNNDGNHGHDVSQYYFIIGFSLCICQLGLASGWAQLVSRLTHSCQQLRQTHAPAIPHSGVMKGKGSIPSHQHPQTQDRYPITISISQPAAVQRNESDVKVSHVFHPVYQERCLSNQQCIYLHIMMCVIVSPTCSWQ